MDGIWMVTSFRNWVSSPLGINMLLSLFKNRVTNVNKYLAISHSLQSIPDIKTKSKIFATETNRDLGILKYKNEDIEFMTDNLKEALSFWAKSDLRSLNLRDVPDTPFILANISRFSGTWQKPKDSAEVLMKIHNSFNYTKDIKYDARILELPLEIKDFKLVVIVPNEKDLLRTLFRRLANESLASAINSIRPIFTITSTLEAPRISFQSHRTFEQDVSDLHRVTVAQFGNTILNENNIYIDVLTYMYKQTHSDNIRNPEITVSDPPFYFGLVFRDTPIFLGQFYK